MQQDDVILVITNAPDKVIAQHIAHTIVAEGLAACVNIGAMVSSVYSWKGQIESSDEMPLTIKTTWARYAKLQTRIKELHPHEIPEILVLPVMSGELAYMTWVRDSTMGTSA